MVVLSKHKDYNDNQTSNEGDIQQHYRHLCKSKANTESDKHGYSVNNGVKNCDIESSKSTINLNIVKSV